MFNREARYLEVYINSNWSEPGGFYLPPDGKTLHTKLNKQTRLADILTLPGALNFPEGPAFASDGSLWCVELLGGNLVRYGRDGELSRFPTAGQPNGLAFDKHGRAWFCDAAQRAIRRFDPKSGKIETVAALLNDVPLNKPNDLAFDPAGNLIFTCPGDSRTEPTGYVACLRPDGTVSEVQDGLYFPNGLAFVDSGRSLVVAETYRQRLWKGTWDASNCSWREPQPWVEVGGPIGPDGMALGADGWLYVAIFGRGVVKAISPDGRNIAEYRLPGLRPTNAAFDPAGKLGLVVTEAEQGTLLCLPWLGFGKPLFSGA